MNPLRRISGDIGRSVGRGERKKKNIDSLGPLAEFMIWNPWMASEEVLLAGAGGGI